MRRFSQRTGLVTLSDINITPLLDLAFVLLIIFVIASPLLEQGMNLKLPTGGSQDDRRIDPRDVRTVEVDARGNYMLARRLMPLDGLVQQLAHEYRRNPKILVYVRADESGPYRHVAAVLNRLERAGIDQVSLRAEPPVN